MWWTEQSETSTGDNGKDTECGLSAIGGLIQQQIYTRRPVHSPVLLLLSRHARLSSRLPYFFHSQPPPAASSAGAKLDLGRQGPQQNGVPLRLKRAMHDSIHHQWQCRGV